MTKTLWRALLYKKLAEHPVHGRTLDVGGDRRSGYHALVHERPADIRVANLDGVGGNDIACDLEKGIPAPDAAFEHVLCINVLEHIFRYEQLLAEMRRVLTGGGTLILAVPFIIQYHPSPRDHWRFSKDTLDRIVRDAGFRNVTVTTLGTGVFGALYQLSHGFLHFGVVRAVARSCAVGLDALVGFVKKGSVYDAEHYPLGYVVVAEK